MFNPSQQLSTMQLLTYSAPLQWDGGENWKSKKEENFVR